MLSPAAPCALLTPPGRWGTLPLGGASNTTMLRRPEHEGLGRQSRTQGGLAMHAIRRLSGLIAVLVAGGLLAGACQPAAPSRTQSSGQAGGKVVATVALPGVMVES